MSYPQRTTSLRNQYVQRAATLQKEPQFLDRVREIRDQWDRQHREFRIGDRTATPEDKVPTYNNVALPTRLDRALKQSRERLDQLRADHLPAESPQMSEWLARDAYVSQLAHSWSEFIGQECERWWWPRYFPKYLGSTHPASLFLSLVIVYDERVPLSETIFVDPIGLSWMPHRESGARDPDVIFATTLETEMRRVFADRPEDIREIVRAALQAKNDARLEQQKHRHQGHWYVELIPGMTSGDWRGLESEVLAKLKELFGENRTRDHVLQLAGENVERNQIAKLLGVSESTVDSYLK